MTNMEKVKERIERMRKIRLERMRKIRPDDNGLMYLQEFVERIISEESKPKQIAEPTVANGRCLPKGRTCHSCLHTAKCKQLGTYRPDSVLCDWDPCRYAEYHEDMVPEPMFMREVCKALGWQGGTVHGAIKEIARLKLLDIPIESNKLLAEIENASSWSDAMDATVVRLSAVHDIFSRLAGIAKEDNMCSILKMKCTGKDCKLPEYKNCKLNPQSQGVQMTSKLSDLMGQHKMMVELARDTGLGLAADWAVDMSGRTFSEKGEATVAPKPTESLAELAARKGYSIVEYEAVLQRFGCAREVLSGDAFTVTIGKDFNYEMIADEKEFGGETYAAAEQAAHQYLNSLPDVNKDGVGEEKI